MLTNVILSWFLNRVNNAGLPRHSNFAFHESAITLEKKKYNCHNAWSLNTIASPVKVTSRGLLGESRCGVQSAHLNKELHTLTTMREGNRRFSSDLYPHSMN